jgi:hypothetical protein
MPPKIKRAARKGICIICKKPIVMQIFKGGNVCCELCRKKRDDDFKPAGT